MRADQFEQRLAEWLEDGPLDAPDRAVDVAIAHAREHPRHRVSLAHIADALGLRTGPGAWAPPGRGAGRLTAIATVAAVVLVTVVAGGGYLLLRAGLAGFPMVLPGAVPSAPGVVMTSSGCSELAPGDTWMRSTAAGDVMQRRDVRVACSLAASDPRLSGTLTYDRNEDVRPDGSAASWGSATIDTSGGTWQGYWLGTVDAGGTTQRIEAAYLGTGGYEGLRLRTSQAGGELAGTIRGTIGNSDALTPLSMGVIVAEHDCSTRAAGTTTYLGSVTRVRDLQLTCAVWSPDPRLVASAAVVVADIDQQADGSATMRGTMTQSNATGSWSATWTGTVEVGYTTHRMAGTATGSGAFAGQTLRFSQIGSPQLLVQLWELAPAR